MEAQELLQDIVFVILYGVVMGLGVAGALYLLLRRSNAIAPEVTPPLRLRRWAAAIMLENVLSHVLWLWYFCHPSITGYVLVCTQEAPTIASRFPMTTIRNHARPTLDCPRARFAS